MQSARLKATQAVLERAMQEELAAKSDSVNMLGAVLAAATRHLVDEIDRLEARLAAIEHTRSMHFCGPHDPAKAYGAGAVVLRAGSVFVAMTPTCEPPGSSDSWRRIGPSK